MAVRRRLGALIQSLVSVSDLVAVTDLVAELFGASAFTNAEKKG